MCKHIPIKIELLRSLTTNAPPMEFGIKAGCQLSDASMKGYGEGKLKKIIL